MKYLGNLVLEGGNRGNLVIEILKVTGGLKGKKTDKWLFGRKRNEEMSEKRWQREIKWLVECHRAQC